MKRMFVIMGLSLLGIIVIIVIIVGIGLIGQFIKLQNNLKAIQIESIDFTKVKDGQYESALDLKLVTAKVKVTVTQKKVTKIDIIEHIHGPNPKYGAESLPAKIIEAQSLDVDSISGATGSSKVMKKAIEQALKKGL